MAEEKIDLQGLKGEVEALYGKHLLARITFKGITPWWGGDYEGRTSRWVDEDEIAGRLRWFLRTVYNRFCANNLDNYNESERWVSQVLGSTSGRSRYSFKVRDVKYRENSEYGKVLERVRLVTRGKDKDYYPIDMDQFTLEVLRFDENSKFDELVVSGLLITLAFLGVGKGVTRGFGRFIPEGCGAISSNLCEYVRRGRVKEAFESFYSSFRRITGCNKENSWTESAVPLAPLTEDGPDSIKETHCTANDVITVLNVIQRSVMKSTFKTISYHVEIKDPGPFIHTWVFGLPRHSKVPKDVNQEKMKVDLDGVQIDEKEVKGSPFMGYLELSKDQQGKNHLVEPRRQSMFVISPVWDGTKYKIYIIPFLSLKDNEDKVKVLVHKGIHTGTNKNARNIDRNKIHLVLISDVLNEKLNGKLLYSDEQSIANSRRDLSYGSVRDIIKNYGNELMKVIEEVCKGTYGKPKRGR